MLSNLRIRNLALLEAVELELTKEFIAITGETGAGKSVLVGALRFLSGSRADKSIVREGAAACEVEGALHFEDTATVDALLEELGLPKCEENQMILYRSIGVSKPSKITINGQLSSLNALQKLGSYWLEYNSPEAVLELYTVEEQLTLLDRYGKVDLSQYTQAYQAYRKSAEKLEVAKSSGTMSPDEIAFMEQQIQKIDNLRLSAESVDALENEYKRLNNIEDELGTAQSIVEAFNEARALQSVLVKARHLSAQNKSYKPLVDRLEPLIIELDDQEMCWKETARENDISMSERERIQERMGEWMELKRRHMSLEGVMAHREQLADKIQLQQNMEIFIDQYERELETALKVLQMEQQKVNKVRLKAAQTLVDATVPLLKRLGLPKAELSADFTPTEKPTANGSVNFELRFNANPGQPLKPMAQIASSGELARVMLALKTVLIKASAKPVIVFDEVDANVGGEVATAVAELLTKLGADHQVFCITHLPQVAAKANYHLIVRKNLLKAATTVTIESATDQRKRLEELARMLGDRNATTALEHAKALLGT